MSLIKADPLSHSAYQHLQEVKESNQSDFQESCEDGCIKDDEADEKLQVNPTDNCLVPSSNCIQNQQPNVSINYYRSKVKQNSNILISSKGKVKDIENFKEELRILFELTHRPDAIKPSDRMISKREMLSKLKLSKSHNLAGPCRFSVVKNDSLNIPVTYSKEPASCTYSRAEGKRIPSHKIIKELFSSIKVKNECLN